ncbi:unnamed protein product [Gordionus sp. m RMFG-2023]
MGTTTIPTLSTSLSTATTAVTIAPTTRAPIVVITITNFLCDIGSPTPAVCNACNGVYFCLPPTTQVLCLVYNCDNNCFAIFTDAITGQPAQCTNVLP